MLFKKHFKKDHVHHYAPLDEALRYWDEWGGGGGGGVPRAGGWGVAPTQGTRPTRPRNELIKMIFDQDFCQPFKRIHCVMKRSLYIPKLKVL